SLDVRKIAQPFMARLLEETSETVHLSLLDGLEVVYVEKLDGVLPIRAYTSLGSRAPAYAVATGKALLAEQNEALFDRFEGALEAYTKLTVVEVPALKREARKVREQGYAINRGEWRAGVGGVASPVFDGAGQAIAALGISGPTERLTPAKMKQQGPFVRSVAQELSRAMGHQGSR
ncbi:MAG: IclR family transcriptional regulator, partial [Limibacillus sp.]